MNFSITHNHTTQLISDSQIHGLMSRNRSEATQLKGFEAFKNYFIKLLNTIPGVNIFDKKQYLQNIYNKMYPPIDISMYTPINAWSALVSLFDMMDEETRQQFHFTFAPDTSSVQITHDNIQLPPFQFALTDNNFIASKYIQTYLLTPNEVYPTEYTLKQNTNIKEKLNTTRNNIDKHLANINEYTRLYLARNPNAATPSFVSENMQLQLPLINQTDKIITTSENIQDATTHNMQTQDISLDEHINMITKKILEYQKVINIKSGLENEFKQLHSKLPKTGSSELIDMDKQIEILKEHLKLQIKLNTLCDFCQIGNVSNEVKQDRLQFVQKLQDKYPLIPDFIGYMRTDNEDMLNTIASSWRLIIARSTNFPHDLITHDKTTISNLKKGCDANIFEKSLQNYLVPHEKLSLLSPEAHQLLPLFENTLNLMGKINDIAHNNINERDVTYEQLTGMKKTLDALIHPKDPKNSSDPRNSPLYAPLKLAISDYAEKTITPLLTTAKKEAILLQEGAKAIHKCLNEINNLLKITNISGKQALDAIESQIIIMNKYITRLSYITKTVLNEPLEKKHLRFSSASITYKKLQQIQPTVFSEATAIIAGEKIKNEKTRNQLIDKLQLFLLLPKENNKMTIKFATSAIEQLRLINNINKDFGKISQAFQTANQNSLPRRKIRALFPQQLNKLKFVMEEINKLRSKTLQEKYHQILSNNIRKLSNIIKSLDRTPIQKSKLSDEINVHLKTLINLAKKISANDQVDELIYIKENNKPNKRTSMFSTLFHAHNPITAL